MRILWIKAGGLVPLDTGGKIRSYHTLAELAKRHSVTVYTFYRAHTGDDHARLSETVNRVLARPLSLPPTRGFRDSLLFARNLAAGRSHTMGKYYLPRVKREVSDLIRSEAFDVIVCDFIYPAGLLDWSDTPPTVLFTHNVEAEVWDRQAEVTGNPVMRVALQLEARALRRAEDEFSARAAHVIAVSERNAEYFEKMAGPDRVSVVPTGVDVAYFAEETGLTPLGPRDIVFTGSMDWLPNDDSVRHFVQDILPRVLKAVPDARFWAVGRNPSTSLRTLDDGHRIRVTGAVDDIRPYLGGAAVFVVPMRSGSGTRLKIYEAMAASKAIVSTTVGAEGLAVRDGETIRLADDPDRFAAAVTELLLSPDEARSLGEAARRHVVEHHSWAAAVRPFEAVLERVVRPGPPDSSR